MTLGTTCAAVLAGSAMVGCVVSLAGAKPTDPPRRLSACSPGGKSVSLTAVGDQLIYAFGTPSRMEMSIVASAVRKNVLYRADRHAGMEHQLRFVNGPYSYVVYSMDGNVRTGATPVS